MHSEISFLLTFPNLRSGRARLSHQHTSSCSLVRRQQKQTDRRVTLCFFLTGPHTFTADSPVTQGSLSTISGVPDPQVHGAVKASVPKLLSCPGASASSPLTGSSRRNAASRQLRKPTTSAACASLCSRSARWRFSPPRAVHKPSTCDGVWSRLPSPVPLFLSPTARWSPEKKAAVRAAALVGDKFSQFGVDGIRKGRA